MKKVYLVYHLCNYNGYYVTTLKKAFQTRHEAEEYIDTCTDNKYNYRIEIIKIEPKKKKILDKIENM